jgi:hypothetical protein
MTNDINLLFETTRSEQLHIDEYNGMLGQLDERKRKRCTIYPTDSGNQIRKKCKLSKIWGIHHAPVWDRYMSTDNSISDTGDSGADVGGDSGGDSGGIGEYNGSGLVYPNSIGPEHDDEFINDVKQLKTLTYTSPDIEYEWGEALRYPELKKLGKELWKQSIQDGNIVPWSALEDVQNFDENLKNLDAIKIKNVAEQIKTGVIELPIIGVRPNGEYELIGGNTRVAILLRLGYDPQVILIDIPAAQPDSAPATKKRTPPKKKVTSKPTSSKKKPAAKPSSAKSKEKPKSSTERVRRYYRRHPEKVRTYLKKTQDDRVTRNRDRSKAIKKYGKAKMKNHDVHHPNGTKRGGWRLAKKDHGRDKKNENIEYVYLHELLNDGTPPGAWTLIMEGGAAGHMAHPYEDNSLTFADVKDMITKGLVGDLGAEEPVTEKLDGQNIMFTVKNGRVHFARNKGQVKNKGKNALDVSGIRQMFAGRGNIEKAFTGAAEDLQTAIDRLSSERRTDMFADGGKFMNVEIIFPDTKNVIPYDKSVLVFHGSVEYDDEGNELQRSVEDGRTLSNELTKVNAEQQNTFGIRGPKTISFNDASTIENKKMLKNMGARVSEIQKSYDLDDKDTIEDYKLQWWSDVLPDIAQSSGVELSESEFDGIVKRWALGDKSFKVSDIESPETKKWFREFEGTELKSAQREATKPLETIFLQVGALTLRRVTDFLSANNPKIANELKSEVLDAIKQIQQSSDVDKLAALQIQLERLQNIGMDNIVPTEGIVFTYNGKPYKFTGTFAPINQILGTLKFDKGKAKLSDAEAEPQTKKSTKAQPTTQAPPTEEPTEKSEEPQRTVAVFTGRFQPFHAGHHSVYQNLVDRFGKENVYIATSNKTDAITSPFGFSDKKEIMTKMFRIPEESVVQVKNPYAPTELLGKLPPNTIYVTAVSQKDASRLGGKYFKSYDDTPPEQLRGYGEQGYVVIAPEMQLQINGKNISGTQLRSVLGDPKITDRAKKEIFTKVYGKFDNKLFKKVVRTTTDSEEARALTAMHTLPPKQQMPQPEPKKEPVEPQQQVPQGVPGQQIPADAAAKKVEPGQQDMQSEPYEPYEPGETWTTTGGLFGAKNRSGVTRYYTKIQSAQRYAAN